MNFKIKQPLTQKLIIILSVIFILIILCFLGFRYFAPFGKIVSYRFTSKLPGAEKITNFYPEEDTIFKIPGQIIKTPQTKISVKLLSKEIESVKAKLKFKRGQREIKLGVRGNETDNFLYQPLYHSFLQDLNWNKQEQDGITLWQREKRYTSISEFLYNWSEKSEKIFSYFLDPVKIKTLNQTKSQTKRTEGTSVINTSLRGDHSFSIQVRTSPLEVKVAKQDLNGYEGEDKFRVSVLNEQGALAEKVIGDDGVVEANLLRMAAQEETITLEDINPGIYQLDIVYEGTGKDSLITKIEVNQEHIIAKSPLLFCGEKPVTFWTNSKNLTIYTWYEDRLQTVKLDGKYNLEIKEKDKQYKFDLELLSKKSDDSLYEITSPKNDIIVKGDGYFSFSKESFFDSKGVKSTLLTNLKSLDDIDYIITGYSQARNEQDWLIAEVAFNPQKLKIDGDKLYFSLEIPELIKYGGALEIDSFEIEIQHKGLLGSKKISSSKSASAPPKKFPGNILNRISTSVSNLLAKTGQFFKKLPAVFSKSKKVPRPSTQPLLSASPTKALTPTASAVPTKILSPTLRPTLTTSPSPLSLSTTIKVLNGGAQTGSAKKFAEILKTNGFLNAAASNADRQDYEGALVNCSKSSLPEAEKISKLLLSFDYKTINTKQIATTSSEIIIILGKK